MSHIQQIQSQGIFHGLPVYSEDTTGLTAIITGANGISGHYMLRVLAESPKRWKKIYCLSRRPPIVPGGLPSNTEHIPLDFLKDPKEIAATLNEKSVTADHVFFFSYVQPPPKPVGHVPVIFCGIGDSVNAPAVTSAGVSATAGLTVVLEIVS